VLVRPITLVARGCSPCNFAGSRQGPVQHALRRRPQSPSIHRTETMPETQPPPQPRPVMIADLNFEPTESDGEDRPPTPKPNLAAAVPVVAPPAVPADSCTR
jgi:hypothetical protein